VSSVSLASSAADSNTLQAIEQHHAELLAGLSTRTAALLAAVRRGADWSEARDALVTWCRTELLPHADAEEAVLYPAARRLPALEPLIRAMSHEHALLGELVARLASANDAPAALVRAGAAQTLFQARVAKENDLVLPVMVAAHDTSVAPLLAEMHTMIESRDADGAVAVATSSVGAQLDNATHGHSCTCDDDAAAATELDARTIPHAIRHATIFGALETVAPAGQLVLLAPHDPLPLLEQIEQRWPSMFAVEYLERGPATWRLRFTRMAVEPVARDRTATRTIPVRTEEPTVTAEVHAPRRVPAEADGPLDLHAAAEEVLAEASQLRSGRSARTLTPGPGAPLKQTLLALTAGQRLQDHLAPGPTTLLGLRGTALLTHDDAAVTLTDGVWTSCPSGPHSLEAVTDAVVLITVTPSTEPEPPTA
jgi:uncharacterized protein (DUF2249 family)/quercetin dioxygenase-like cupin family protein